MCSHIPTKYRVTNIGTVCYTKAWKRSTLRKLNTSFSLHILHKLNTVVLFNNFLGRGNQPLSRFLMALFVWLTPLTVAFVLLSAELSHASRRSSLRGERVFPAVKTHFFVCPAYTIPGVHPERFSFWHSCSLSSPVAFPPPNPHPTLLHFPTFHPITSHLDRMTPNISERCCSCK